MQATALPVNAPLRPASILTTLAVVAVLVVAALALTQSGDAASTSVNLGLAEAGSVVALEVDSEVTVGLPGNPTTGYTWVVTSVDPAILNQIGEAEYAPESDLIGAGGTLTLRFEALGVGETELELGYLRPWEDAEPLDTYMVKINVR